MESFEEIVKVLFEEDNYWVRQSEKVGLTREEKRRTGKPSIPRPEIDLVALNQSENHILVLEVKSFFDSPGVKLSDLILALFIVSIIIFYRNSRKASLFKINLALITFLLIFSISIEISIKHKLPNGWKESSLLESAYDGNNFNNALVDLVGASDFFNINLVRHKGYILDSKIGLSQKPEIHIGIIKDALTIGDTILNNCWRLGSLTISSGVRINDGQSCHIIGNGEAIIGGRNDAAAIKIITKKQPIIIILDRAFLANKSLQTENIEWMKEQIKLLMG